METWDNPNWGWGLSLIALTIMIHSTAIVMMALVAVRIRARLETRGYALWNLVGILICVIGVIGLLLAVLHAIECAIWAVAYWSLGAAHSFMDAFLYSVDSMSTRGESRLALQPHWR